MRISTSMIPEFVFYTQYSGCTIKQALLHAFTHATNNTLSLPDIGNIKVNGNRLLGSYGDAIRNLRREGYKIDTLLHHDRKSHITMSSYHLSNPTFNPEH